MLKLRVKVNGETAYTVGEFETMAEVTQKILELCEAKSLYEALTVQKELSIRFYLKEKK